LSLPVGASDKLDEMKTTASPAKLLSDAYEKKKLLARFSELDEKQEIF
jgi:hypothetical protein